MGTLMESDAESGADNTENPNLRPDLVAERLRALPCDDLQTALGTPLAVEFSAYSRPEAGQTVVDMANDPGGFDLALYQAGQYGKADGSPAWMITVRQTEDEDRAGTRTARFCFDPVDESCWVGNPDLYAQTDIQVTNEGHLFYTRDWGENWSALPSRFEGQLAECIETCTAITRSSWYGFPPAGRPGGLCAGRKSAGGGVQYGWRRHLAGAGSGQLPPQAGPACAVRRAGWLPVCGGGLRLEHGRRWWHPVCSGVRPVPRALKRLPCLPNWTNTIPSVVWRLADRGSDHLGGDLQRKQLAGALLHRR